MKLLRTYEDGNLSISEYTKDGETISHIVKTPIMIEPVEPTEPQPTVEQRLENIEAAVAYNQLQTEYLVILAEFNAM